MRISVKEVLDRTWGMKDQAKDKWEMQEYEKMIDQVYGIRLMGILKQGQKDGLLTTEKQKLNSACVS